MERIFWRRKFENEKIVLFVSALLSAFLLVGCSTATSNESETVSSKEKESSKVTLYLVRHGKTIFNTTDRVQGWSDSPLTEEGEKVAEHLGKGLTDTDIDYLYSSDLGRAFETAKIIAEKSGNKDLTVETSRNLREMCYGSYEGEKNSVMYDDLAKKAGYQNGDEAFAAMDEGKLSYSELMKELSNLDELGISENSKEVQGRMLKEVTAIAKEAQKKGGGNVFIVSHGGAIAELLSAIKKDDNYALDNASVTSISYVKDEFKVEKVGDMSYVEKGMKGEE